MKPSGKTLAPLGPVALALALGGCVTLFPKAPPAQLYGFGDGPAVAPSPAATLAPAPAGPAVLVLADPNRFAMAAAGDRILTTRGLSAAYVAQARWVSPASVLFDDAEARSFAARGAARLSRRADGARASLALTLDVQSFEARYADGAPTGPRAAPTVVVVVQATLLRLPGRTLLAGRRFESRRPAGEQRVGAIVAAFDEATADVLGQIVDWTAAQGDAPPG